MKWGNRRMEPEPSRPKLLLSGLDLSITEDQGKDRPHQHRFIAVTVSRQDYIVQASLEQIPTAALEFLRGEIERELTRRQDIARIASNPLFSPPGPGR